MTCVPTSRSDGPTARLLEPDSHGSDQDVGTYARDVIEDIGKPWHPSIALFTKNSKSQLLIETDEFAGYTLLELPTFDEGADEAGLPPLNTLESG